MTKTACDWLPASAITEERLTASLAAPFESWAKEWLARNNVKFGFCLEPAPWPSYATGTNLSGAVVSVTIGEAAKKRLVEAALDVALDDVTVNEADQAVLDNFEKQLSASLLECMEGVFDGSASDQSEEEVRIGVSIDETAEPSIEYSLPKTRVFKLIKGQIPHSSQMLKPESRRLAVAQSHVVITANLGDAALPLQDIKGLERGDVVVLEKHLHDSLDLKLQHTDQAIGTGRFESRNGRIDVHI